MGLANGQHDFTDDGLGYTPHVLLEIRIIKDPRTGKRTPYNKLKAVFKEILRKHGCRNMGMEFVEPGFIEELRLKEQTEKTSRTHAA